MNEEEKKLEEEALAKIDESKIREEIILDTGFDEIDHSDQIDKLVAREVKTRTIAAKAIGSKIKTRDELTKEIETLKSTNPPQEGKADPDELDKKLDIKLKEQLDKRDLEAMDYSDELKSEIQKVAGIQGSIKKAISDPYIRFKIEAWEKENKIEEATISRTNKSGTKVGYSMDSPPDVDIKTPEGQKEYEKWKDEMRKQHPLD